MKPALVDVSVLVLFFNRPDLLRQVFNQIRAARPSRLFLYQDGPRNNSDQSGIDACRKIVEEIDWECEVHKNYERRNGYSWYNTGGSQVLRRYQEWKQQHP